MTSVEFPGLVIVMALLSGFIGHVVLLSRTRKTVPAQLAHLGAELSFPVFARRI